MGYQNARNGQIYFLWSQAFNGNDFWIIFSYQQGVQNILYYSQKKHVCPYDETKYWTNLQTRTQNVIYMTGTI